MFARGIGRPQRHVKFQLAAFLLRYGRLGSSALSVAMELSIGEGTVFLYCKRVSRALRQLKSRFLGWPDSARKQVISEAIEHAAGFPKCLGSGDGCLIRFIQKPLYFGHMYKCRKQFFGVCHLIKLLNYCYTQDSNLLKTNIQTVVDHMRRFISFDLGWPGSVTDIKMFKHSYLWTHRRLHFKNGEYILVDKGTAQNSCTRDLK